MKFTAHLITLHEAVLGIRVKSKTEQLGAFAQLRAQSDAKKQKLLGMVLSLGKHTLSWLCWVL